MRRKHDSMDPRTDRLYDERGEEGKANGFYFIEDGLYKAILLATKRWRTPGGVERKKRVTATFAGYSARGLAASLRAAGWEPPKRLAHRCESAPPSWARRHVR